MWMKWQEKRRLWLCLRSKRKKEGAKSEGEKVDAEAGAG